jgi:hypothetical protein
MGAVKERYLKQNGHRLIEDSQDEAGDYGAEEEGREETSHPLFTLRGE